MFEAWAGAEAEGDEIAATDEWGWDERFAGELGGLGVEELVVVGEAVGGSAIDAMEFHFHVEGGFGHEALEFCHAHFLHIHELHVACDHRHDGGDGVVRVAQAAQDVFGHVGAECVVSVESNAAAFRIDAAAGGLCDVV